MTSVRRVVGRLRDREVRRALPQLVTERLRGRRYSSSGAAVARGVMIAGPGELVLGPRTRIKEDARIFIGRGARLELGEGANIGIRNIVNVASSLRIGAGTRIGWDCQIMDTDFHEIYDEYGHARPMTRPVVLGEHVLVGSRSMILKGVTVGDGAVIAAGSVVTRDVEPGTIVAGNPARPVGRAYGWSPGRVGS